MEEAKTRLEAEVEVGGLLYLALGLRVYECALYTRLSVSSGLVFL